MFFKKQIFTYSFNSYMYILLFIYLVIVVKKMLKTQKGFRKRFFEIIYVKKYEKLR